MKRTTPGVISSIRQFVAGQDGPVALIELADGVTVDEIKAKTEAAFKVALDGKQNAA